MKICTLGAIVIAVAATVLLPLAHGPACAADKAPLTPEYAAKRENFRKLNEQRITQEKRNAAAESLKAERLRVYNAKQAVRHAKPEKTDN